MKNLVTRGTAMGRLAITVEEQSGKLLTLDPGGSGSD
jgi:hypothetical protein